MHLQTYGTVLAPRLQASLAGFTYAKNTSTCYLLVHELVPALTRTWLEMSVLESEAIRALSGLLGSFRSVQHLAQSNTHAC
jgi:hypothetical protein